MLCLELPAERPLRPARVAQGLLHTPKCNLARRQGHEIMGHEALLWSCLVLEPSSRPAGPGQVSALPLSLEPAWVKDHRVAHMAHGFRVASSPECPRGCSLTFQRGPLPWVEGSVIFTVTPRKALLPGHRVGHRVVVLAT